MKQWEDGAEGIEWTRKYVRRKTGAGSQGEEIADPLEPPPLKVSCTHSSGVSLSHADVALSLMEIPCSQIQPSDSTRKTPHILFCEIHKIPSGTWPRGRIRPSRTHLTTQPSHFTTRPHLMCSCSRRYPLNSGLDTFQINVGDSAIDEAESAKSGGACMRRHREKVEVTRAVDNGEWNVDSSPAAVSVMLNTILSRVSGFIR